jgi:hypothetical protein
MNNNFLLFLILGVLSCSPSDDNLYEFDPRNLSEYKITLSDLADDITYIPLENSFPIGSFYSYRTTFNTIFVSAKDLGILEFNRNGKFIRNIGDIGRGPGEYRYFMNFAVDPLTNSVYILDNNIIKTYSGRGQFGRTIPLQEYDWRSDNIEFFHNKLIVTENIYNGNAKYSWLILDTTGILLKRKDNSIPAFKCTLPSNGGIYKFGDKIYYWELYNDTVFSIQPDLNYKASFLFSPGDHRWPKSMIKIEPTNSFRSLLFNHLNINLIFETDQFIVIRYTYKKAAIALINKKSKKSFLTFMEIEDETGELHGGIFNNIDGGPFFKPQGYFVENGREYMTELIYPYQLKAYIASKAFNKVTPKYPEKKKELQKLADKLNETDNPILMLVKLKK